MKNWTPQSSQMLNQISYPNQDMKLTISAHYSKDFSTPRFTIQIVKLNGTVIFQNQYSESIPLHILEDIDKEMIEYSRKLPLDLYENQTNQLMIQKYYVCFRARDGLFFVFISQSSFSYPTADQTIDLMMNSFKQIMPNNKICEWKGEDTRGRLNKYLNNFSMVFEEQREKSRRVKSPRGKIIQTKSQGSIKWAQNSQKRLQEQDQQLKVNYSKINELLIVSEQWKQDKKRLKSWHIIQKYLVLFSFFLCFMIAFYIFRYYY